MLSTEDLSNIPSQPSLGSVWNRAGTWEEKNLNTWATDRIKELLSSVGCLGFSNGKAEVTEVSRCTGDAFLVTVRNKKRVGYTFDITIEVKGEWTVGNEKRKIKGHLGIPELSYGELDELQHNRCTCEEALVAALHRMRPKQLDSRATCSGSEDEGEIRGRQGSAAAI